MKTKIKFLLIPIAIIFTVLISTPIQAEKMPSNNNLNTDLKTHHQLWQSQKITHYQYTYKRVCFCPLPANTPVKISVKNNQITAVTPLETEQPLEEINPEAYKTIDQLFEIIENAMVNNADKITVTYDSKLGYPTQIVIDYIELAADDEMTYIATDLIKIDS